MNEPHVEISASRSDGDEVVTNRFFTISNMLSVARAFLAAPFAIVMLSGRDDATFWGIIILVLAVLTDKFDGVLARKYNQITEWGKILDPLADKIGIAVVAIVLLALGKIPLWFIVIMLLRDVLILLGGMYIKRIKGVVLQSNQLGKWTIGTLAAAMLLAMIDAGSEAVSIGIAVSVLMLVVSLAAYLKRFVEELREPRASLKQSAGG